METTERFSSRVADYVKYRPSYPPGAIDLLIRACGLTRESHVADLGSGTGIFSRQLLERGLHVTAIEPNEPMRRAAEAQLASFDRFTSVDATAEAIPLNNDSVDLITVAQAFHWFDHEKCRVEFSRILKPSGSVALLWNHRLTDTAPFLRGYEAILQTYGTDYNEVNHVNITPERIARFFAPGPCVLHRFPNTQRFDFDGARGRLTSSSYAPPPGHANHEPMLTELRRLFDAHQREGEVVFEYVTQVYVGRFGI